MITLVIPYLHTPDNGAELKLALRSWEEHFCEDFKVVIIGDREDWFNDKAITHIPCDRPSDNPQVNVFLALKTAIASDKVSDDFIWSNDDIYLTAPIRLPHISIPKFIGELDPNFYPDPVYRQNCRHTLNFLSHFERFDILNFGSHTPYLFNKVKIVEILERFPALDKGHYLIATIYFNLFREVHALKLDWPRDSWAISAITPDAVDKGLAKYVKNKCFLNNSVSGWSPKLKAFLYELFPDRSEFEKDDEE